MLSLTSHGSALDGLEAVAELPPAPQLPSSPSPFPPPLQLHLPPPAAVGRLLPPSVAALRWHLPHPPLWRHHVLLLLLPHDDYALLTLLWSPSLLLLLLSLPLLLLLPPPMYDSVLYGSSSAAAAAVSPASCAFRPLPAEKQDDVRKCYSQTRLFFKCKML